VWIAVRNQQQLFQFHPGIDFQFDPGIDFEFNNPRKQQPEQRQLDQFWDDPDAWNAVPTERFTEQLEHHDATHALIRTVLIEAGPKNGLALFSGIGAVSEKIGFPKA
jgi:hypothetical protein